MVDVPSTNGNADDSQSSASDEHRIADEWPGTRGASGAGGGSRDLRWILRGSLALDLFVRLTIWAGALALGTAAFDAINVWPKGGLTRPNLPTAILWAVLASWWVLLFNLIYVAELVVLRLIIPTPREGRYVKGKAGQKWQLLLASLGTALNKARYQAPFPGFVVFHIANLPPMCWLMGPVFGPRSRSCYAMEPNILDPQFVELGRNVVIGFNATVAGHYQEREAWVIKRTVIADDVVIGGHAVIYGGVRIGAGAVIGAGAIVLPNTVVGPNEFWAGIPAKKVRDLPPPA
jgi:acetyltransferase-like isoleucine patch superfamily enzyme